MTVSICGNATMWEKLDMDTIIQLFQDSVEGICVGVNDDHVSCSHDLSLITFDDVDKPKYIVLVAGYDNSEGTFTLLVGCDQPIGMR